MMKQFHRNELLFKIINHSIIIHLPVDYFYKIEKSVPWMYAVTHREILLNQTESDCIYHFPTNLEQQMDSVRLVPNQSENDKYNLISV